jgi:TrmH family RNA methyltransferase
MEYTITSRDNNLIKHIKSLHQKKHRDDEGQFFVEGIKMVEEAIRQKTDIVNIVASIDMLTKISGGIEFADKLKEDNISTILVPESIFSFISDTETPQGVLAVIKKKCVIENEGIYVKNGTYILLDGVQDPGNVGSIIRTADAAGINGVILSRGCADIYNPKTLRSTMGSIFRVPIIDKADLHLIAKAMKKQGIIVLTSSLKSENYHYDVDYEGGIALVIGSEANGVGPEMMEMADLLVKIPMRGGAESLNASVAAGILIYEVMREKLTLNP